MNASARALSLALPIPFLFVARDELVARTAADEVRTRHFSVATELTLDEMTVSIDGEDMDMESMGGAEMTDRAKLELEVSDSVEAVEDGRATRFVRKYVSATRSSSHDSKPPGGQTMTGSMEGSSPLAGREVEFALEDGEFKARFADGAEDPDGWLDGLRAELDLDDFLPDGEVAVDDAWDVDASSIVALLRPGGTLPFEDEGEGELGVLERRLRANAALEDYEGTFRAVYKGTREEDGRKLATIELTCELECTASLTELLKGEEPTVEGPEGVEIKLEVVSADLEHALEGGGTLEWDVERGMLASLALELEVQRTNTTEMSIDLGERKLSQVQTQVFTGKTSIAVEFE